MPQQRYPMLLLDVYDALAVAAIKADDPSDFVKSAL